MCDDVKDKGRLNPYQLLTFFLILSILLNMFDIEFTAVTAKF